MGYAFNPFTGNLDVATASTGGSGTTLTREDPGGTIDGSNTSFTVANTPVLVEIDGVFAVDGYGYAYTPGNIAVDPLRPPTKSIVSFYNA